MWTQTPTEWSHQFFKSLFAYEWELTKSPAGAHQWVAKNSDPVFPDAFDSTKKHRPTMWTTDLSLRFDPDYEKISRRFLDNPEEFDDAFARAWFKLTHRDMGPKQNLLGPEVPEEEFLWQDPIPVADYDMINAADIAELKKALNSSGLGIQEMVSTAWASASSYRGSDLRGRTNGGRVRLAPQKDWEANNPEQLSKVLAVYEKIQADFNASHGKRKVSMADLIVLAGNVGIEKAAKNAGMDISVPFKDGITDASQDQTDVEGMAVLEPMADGFRNYQKTDYTLSSEELLVDKAQLLTLTAPEMTVLVGGMRTLGTNYNGSKHGVFTTNQESLTSDFFVNLLSMRTAWSPTNEEKSMFEGKDRKTGKVVWTATRADLVFGSNSELRAIAEVYGSQDAQEKFVNDFVAAWVKVMNLGCFNLD